MTHVADRFVAILDANVLYSSLKRNSPLSFADEGLYRTRWTDHIMKEWTTSLLKKRPGIKEKIDATVAAKGRAFPEAKIEGHEPFIEGLALPDPNDRHVFAAAVKSGAHIIVTENKKDFPLSVLAPLDIEIQTADEFLLSTFELYSSAAEQAIRKMRGRYRNPAHSADELLTMMTADGLVRLANELRQRIDAI